MSDTTAPAPAYGPGEGPDPAAGNAPLPTNPPVDLQPIAERSAQIFLSLPTVAARRSMLADLKVSNPVLATMVVDILGKVYGPAFTGEENVGLEDTAAQSPDASMRVLGATGGIGALAGAAALMSGGAGFGSALGGGIAGLASFGAPAQGSQAIQQAAPHAPEQMLADAGLGGIYTNPLSSKVIRWAIGAAIALLCSKVFKYTASDAQMQDWIELGCGLLSLAVIAYHRLKSTNTIMSLQDATTMFVSHFSTIDNRIVQRDVLNALQQKNPKLYANVKTVLQFFSH